MKRIISSVILCAFLAFNLFAQENLLRQLIDLPAPPVTKTEDENGEERTRPVEFFKKENVPPDDAPIEDLIDFWKMQNFITASHPDKIKPSEKTLQRLIKSIEDKPENLKIFLTLLTADEDVAEIVKDIYDAQGQNFDDSWRESVGKWLKYKSKYFSDQLFAEAQNAKDHKTYNTVIKEEELRALAKVDWEKAESLLQRLETDKNNPRTAFFAKRLIYEHAIEEKDSAAIEKYRSEFQKIVENKNASGIERDNALDALIQNKEWQGQDDWYVSLFEDETLLELNLGESTVSYPLNGIVSSAPDKWIPVVVKLINHKNRAVHNSAVQALSQFANKDARRDALEPLIPWISNPDWAEVETDGRFRLIQSMDTLDMPESIPGLIWVLENDDESYTRSYAAESLGKYKDPRIAPAMKAALQKEPAETHRQRIILAMIRNQSLTDDEQIVYLESYANEISTPEGFKKVEERSEYEDENPLPIEVSIGKYLAMQSEPSEGLILRMLERVKILEKEKSDVAKILSGIMEKWQGRLIDLEMLDRIETGRGDAEMIVGALARRKELKERVANELYAMRGKSGLPGALAACLLEDENEVLSVFRSQNLETQIAALACARLLRKPLPIREVGVLLDSNNKLLALAAERYLESEDSVEARNLVLAKHPGEALILGARDSFNPAKADYLPTLGALFASVNNSYGNYLNPGSSYYTSLDKFENKLRDEIKTNQDLLEIYAIVPLYAVRIYKDRAVLTWYEDAARYREKILKKEEVEDLRRFVAESKIENSPPVFGNCHHNCGIFEFVRLTRGGGRRFFAYTNFMAFIGFQMKFQSLAQSRSWKLRYYLQDKINGLEILLTDERHAPQTIWKNGSDFRVLVKDKVREREIEEELERQNEVENKNEELDWREKERNRFRRKTEREFEHYEWRKFSNGKLGESIYEPAEIPFLRDKLTFPAIEDLSSNDNKRQTFYGNYEIRAGGYGKGGLWKINRGEQLEFKEGIYANPIVSGNWVVAAKTDESWAIPNYVVKINLQTGKEAKIDLPPAQDFNPVAFIPAHNKVLLYRDADPDSSKPAEYYLLNANKGKTKLVKGDFRPLLQQTFRPLQTTGNANEFWAAIYDKAKNHTEIGRYDAENFTFKAVLTIPEINLNSMQIWVDEKESKVYFVYQGDYFGESHLLSLPLLK